MYQQLEGLGELGRSAGQTTFDTEREKLWKEFLAHDGSLYQPAAQLKLGVEAVQQSMSEIKSIMDRHTALYQSLQGQVDNSWLAPRYNDFQTVFEGRYKQELDALGHYQAVPPSAQTTGAPVIVQPQDLTQPTQLIISGGGVPTGSLPASSGGGASSFVAPSPYGDIYGDSGAAQGAPGAGVGQYLPFIVGGVALALLLRRR